MSFLLRLVGSYVDAVLNTFYPLEREPSMADLNADGLADKEAEEEVSEPVLQSESAFHTWRAEQEEVGTGGRVGPEDVWPEDPYADAHPMTSTEIARLRLLLHDYEEVCEMYNLSSAAPSVAESPGSVVPPADPGHPEIAIHDRQAAASAIAQWIAGDPCPPHNHDAWRLIAKHIYNYADFTK